jgi:hypothetical protein
MLAGMQPELPYDEAPVGFFDERMIDHRRGLNALSKTLSRVSL